MKFKNIYTFGIIIGITTTLLIMAYFLLNLNEENPAINESNNIYKNNSIENSSVYYNDVNVTESLITFNLSFDKIPHNTKPTFKVGEKFEYLANSPLITTEGLSGDTKNIQQIIYSVIRKEMYKGKECYVIEGTSSSVMTSTNISKLSTLPKQKVKHLFYIDVETGRGIYWTSIPPEDRTNKIPKEFKRFFGEIPSEISEAYSILPGCFTPWMLSLNDDFKMEIKEIKSKIAKEEIKVIRRDKFKNRECYVVERRSIDENNKVLGKKISWIDIKKRILVKEEAYWENLKIGDLELVSELK